MTKPMTITDLSSIRMIVCEHAEDHDLPGQPKVLRHPRAPYDSGEPTT